MGKKLIWIVIALAFLIIFYLIWTTAKNTPEQSGVSNFDECAAAGYPIMKSNPPQCATPDGKTFTDQTNSTWEMAILAINNCEVSKIFQTHSRIVTLTLKNGNKLTSLEPQIDDVFDIANIAQAKCGKLLMGTE